LPKHKIFISILAFYAGWVACVMGATNGNPFMGPVVVAVIVILSLWMQIISRPDIYLALVSIPLGILLDSVLSSIGVFSYQSPLSVTWLSPPWMVALWVNFVIILRGPLGWMEKKYWLGAVFGALGGPLSYYAGLRLGGLTALWSIKFFLGIVAMEWAVAMPVLLWFVRITREMRPASA
jgi:hypothetical protein